MATRKPALYLPDESCVRLFLPAESGYVRYDFLHWICKETNADVWRINAAAAADDALRERFPLTAGGEWETALLLRGRPDFCGGRAHGDHIFQTIHFTADGVPFTPAHAAAPIPFTDLRASQNDTLFDPADSVTPVARRHCVHRFTAGEMTVTQRLEWLGAFPLTRAFLAMFTPRWDVTGNWYTDNDPVPKKIDNSARYSFSIPGARKLVIYGDHVRGDFWVTRYPELPGGCALMTNNGHIAADAYNKGYFMVCDAFMTEAGMVWESEAHYRFSVTD